MGWSSVLPMFANMKAMSRCAAISNYLLNWQEAKDTRRRLDQNKQESIGQSATRLREAS